LRLIARTIKIALLEFLNTNLKDREKLSKSKVMDKILVMRIDRELYSRFYAVNGKNSNAIIRALIEGYLIFVLTEKGEKKK